jgi:IS4 transposase
MEQFVQLPRRDAAHFVRRSEENAPLKASRKNRDS